MLKSLEKEISLNKQKFEEERSKLERDAEERIGMTTAEKRKIEREKFELEQVKMDLHKKLESTEQVKSARSAKSSSSVATKTTTGKRSQVTKRCK